MIDKISKIFFLLFLISSSSFSQYLPGAKHIALSEASLGQDGDIFSVFYNPAGTAIQLNRTGAIFYSPAPFGLNELKNGFISYREPTIYGNLSFGIKHFGFELYKENEIIINYSNSIDGFYYGINVSYNNLQIKRYGSTSNYNISLGGIYFVENYLSIAFSALNVLRNDNLHIPNIFQLGFSLAPIKKITFFASVSKEDDFNFEPKFGLSYQLIDLLSIHLGAKNNPSSYSGGIGIAYNSFILSLAISYHQQLGMSKQFDLIVNF